MRVAAEPSRCVFGIHLVRDSLRFSVFGGLLLFLWGVFFLVFVGDLGCLVVVVVVECSEGFGMQASWKAVMEVTKAAVAQNDRSCYKLTNSEINKQTNK